MSKRSTGEPSTDALSPSVVCLQCGYDLRGIPERRCPECGHGYDDAAIRAISSEECWLLDCSYRKITRLSAIAAALSMSPLCWTMNLGPGVTFPITLVSLLIGVLLWRRFTPARPPGSWSGTLLILFVVSVPLLFSPFLLAFPKLGIGLAVGFIGWAVVEWISSCSRSPYSPANVSANDEQLLGQDRRIAIIGFLGASLLTLLAWT